MLSIQTNVNSLVAQQNLNVNNQFQSNTIQQLTSGYRINQSGDDAAGLAVANQFRNNIAEVTQGVANGNDAVAQLQIMDGGMSNISQILDRLQTLATQSATSTFTGDRNVLNSEFQTDVSEITRQAQAIGLNTGGTFAKDLSIYLGGGQGTSAASALTNGTVNLNLSNSTVDAQSLGLNGVQATNTTAANTTNPYDLSASSATSVQAIIAANDPTLANTSFTFTGPGFSDTSGVTIGVNLNGVANTTDLVNNINAAIQSAAEGTGGNDAAFKAANITASIVTTSSGKQQLAFNSSNAAFSVTSGNGLAADATAAALMGSLVAAGAPAGTATVGAITEVAGGSYELGSAATATTAASATDFTLQSAITAGTQAVSINAVDASGNQHSLTVNLAAGNTGTLTNALTAINTALQQSDDSTLQQIAAVQTGSGTSTTFNFVSTLPNFSVSVGADTTANTEGVNFAANPANTGVAMLGKSVQVGAGSSMDISTIAGASTAVSAVSAAVSALGTAQAAIGKGENQLNYAINLASSQITNFSAAESQIRDADVAAQAANLTKAQTLQQASIAAMAQANSAPQAVLSLLKT
jgi:flagellin